MAGASPCQRWFLSPDRSITLDRPRLIGILNVTPDSFSDGGAYTTTTDAVEHALEMESNGADLVDVGGESTRPGADRIEASVQVDRVVPVIIAIRRRTEIPISIDTTLAEVAEAALDAGAQVINDVSAGTEDEAMIPLAAQRRCGLILMHRLFPPGQDCYSTEYQEPPGYADVVAEVVDELVSRARLAESAGVDPASIVLDPGLGFGKSVEQNWQLINETQRLTSMGYPWLGAASRKSFLAALCGPDTAPEKRGPASVAASIIQHRGGIRLFRVHDVGLHATGLASASRLPERGEPGREPAIMTDL